MKSPTYYIIVLFFLLFATNKIHAQSKVSSDSATTFNNQTIQKNSSLFNRNRMSFSVEAGFGVIGSKKNATTFSYISPYMSYMVTPRFKLDVGGVIQQGISGFSNNEFNSFGGNGTNYMLFARGDYLVTNRLIISGAVYKTFNNSKSVNPELLSNKKNTLDNYGINVGVDYKVTEHLTIGAQINFSNRNNNPYYQSQMNPYGGGFQSGFNNNPFHNGYSNW